VGGECCGELMRSCVRHSKMKNDAEGRKARSDVTGTETDLDCTASKWFAWAVCWQQLCEAGTCMLLQFPFIL